MLTLKKFDFYGQVILIIISVLLPLLPLWPSFLTGYFLVGGWQITTAAIHFGYRDRLLLSRFRKKYLNVLSGVIIVGLMTLLFPMMGFFYLFGLLLVSPMLALAYIRLTWLELQTWEAKAFVHLK